MIRECEDCGRSFEADERWKVRCLDCFKDHKRAEEASGPGWRSRSRPRSRPRATTAQPYEAHARAAFDAVLGAFAAGRDEGYTAGHADGLRAGRQAAGPARLPVEFLRDLVALCHPDRHPGRQEKANTVTARLLELVNDSRRAA